MYSPCITIQVRDTQHSLVGLGPPQNRTSTVGAPGKGRCVPTSFSRHFSWMADPERPLPLATVIWFRSLEFMSLGHGYDMVLLPPRHTTDEDYELSQPGGALRRLHHSQAPAARRRRARRNRRHHLTGGRWDSSIRRPSAGRQPRLPH
jgi:hypothetical protein